MLYVGLDIHIKNIFICILNDNGKIERQLKVRQVDQMMDVLNKLPCCPSQHSGDFCASSRHLRSAVAELADS